MWRVRVDARRRLPGVSVAGLIPLSQLWFAEAYDRLDREFAVDAIGPQEVLWRDCGDGEWQRAE